MCPRRSRFSEDDTVYRNGGGPSTRWAEFMVSDARTDFDLLMSLLFLLRTGGGAWSVDARLLRPHATERLP